MSSVYFEKFPRVDYNNKTLINLLKKNIIVNAVFLETTNFFPYIIEEGERPDMVSYNYYGDSDLVWLIMLANDMIDPYFDWYLDTNTFDKFLIKKYGSVALSKSEILHYKHKTKNYIISNDTYENGITNYTFVPTATADDFSAVYAYDYEFDENESRKFIRLLDSRLVPQVVEEARLLLNGK